MNGKISLKRKAFGSFVGGILSTIFMTWIFVGLILSLVGIRLGGLPIPFWFGNDKIEWLAFAFDVLFWSDRSIDKNKERLRLLKEKLLMTIDKTVTPEEAERLKKEVEQAFTEEKLEDDYPFEDAEKQKE